MNKLKFSSFGLASLGSVVAIGIVTAPAQAVSIEGSLEWDNGTSSFIEDVDFIVGNSFDVTFSPDGIAATFGASGDFGPPLFNPPELVDVTPVTGTFLYAGNTGLPADEAFYNLVGDLAFEFDNGVTKTLPDGSTFIGILEQNAVEFDLVDGQWLSEIPGFDPTTATSSAFEFEQTAGADFGGYVAQNTEVSVPEPGTILGLLAVGGLGLGLKRKKQS